MSPATSVGSTTHCVVESLTFVKILVTFNKKIYCDSTIYCIVHWWPIFSYCDASLAKKTLDQFFKLNLYEFVLSLNSPGAIHPILQNSKRSRNLKIYVPQTAVTLSVFASVCILLLWLQYSSHCFRIFCMRHSMFGYEK